MRRGLERGSGRRGVYPVSRSAHCVRGPFRPRRRRHRVVPRPVPIYLLRIDSVALSDSPSLQRSTVKSLSAPNARCQARRCPSCAFVARPASLFAATAPRAARRRRDDGPSPVTKRARRDLHLFASCLLGGSQVIPPLSSLFSLLSLLPPLSPLHPPLSPPSSLPSPPSSFLSPMYPHPHTFSTSPSRY